MTLRRLFPSLVSLSVLLVLAPAGLSAQATRVDDLTYPPLRAQTVPTPTRVVLDNGMTVMLIEDHELPIIEAQAVFRGGSFWEPADKVGLSVLTGIVMRSGGSEKIPGDALDDLLEDRAASIETGLGGNGGNASLDCLAGDFPELLQVFSDLIRHPAFEEDKLAVAKNQLETGIARQNDSPGAIAGREMRELLFGADSPLARTETYATVRAITRDDLVAWHARWLQPQNVILGLVGDFDTQQALARVREVFGDWPRGTTTTPPLPTVSEPQPGVFFAAKDDVNQSTIRLGHLGIKKDDPRFYAVEVLNEILGGSFASRLFTNVRSKKGLAYDARGGVGSGFELPGTFTLSMSTKTETTAAGIDALLEEARGLTTHPPSESEVARAKRAILAREVFQYDSIGKVLGQQMRFEYYGYPLDWLARYRAGIEAVTVDAVRQAAAELVRPDRLVMLVVGKRDGLDRPLSSFGEVRELDISIPEPPSSEAAVEVTAEGAAIAKALLDRAVVAIGGAERLASLQSVALDNQVALETPGGTMQVGSGQLLVLPGRSRQEMRAPFGVMAQVLDGDGGFASSPRGVQALSPDQWTELRQDLAREVVVLLREHAAGTLEAVAAGDGQAGDTAVKLVRVDAAGAPTTIGIDENGRVLLVRYSGRSLTGSPGTLEQVFADFREVGGLVLPYASTVTFEGQRMLATTTTSIVVDGPVDEALFARPE